MSLKLDSNGYCFTFEGDDFDYYVTFTLDKTSKETEDVKVFIDFVDSEFELPSIDSWPDKLSFKQFVLDKIQEHLDESF